MENLSDFFGVLIWNDYETEPSVCWDEPFLLHTLAKLFIKPQILYFLSFVIHTELWYAAIFCPQFRHSVFAKELSGRHICCTVWLAPRYLYRIYALWSLGCFVLICSISMMTTKFNTLSDSNLSFISSLWMWLSIMLAVINVKYCCFLTTLDITNLK